MEREVGGGIGMGNICKPMPVSFQCITKSTTIKKKNEDNDLYLVVWLKIILLFFFKIFLMWTGPF